MSKLVTIRAISNYEERTQIRNFSFFAQNANSPDESLCEVNTIFGAYNVTTNVLLGYLILEPSTHDLPPNIQFVEVTSRYQRRGNWTFVDYGSTGLCIK